MRVAMQEREQNCTTAHQRPILGATIPHQKKPQQYESLQKALHIFSGVNCPPGHSFHRPAVGLPAICSLHSLHTSRRSFRRFLARPEKALLALPPPAAGSGAQSRPRPTSLLSALNLLTNSSRPPAPTWFFATFAHLSGKCPLTQKLNWILNCDQRWTIDNYVVLILWS